MTFLLNRPMSSYMIAILFAITVGLLPVLYLSLNPIYDSLDVSAMLSLLGFVIAAFTILISVQDRGFMQKIAEGEGNLWALLFSEFFNTSRLLGGFTIFLLLTSGAKDAQLPNLLERVYYASFTFFLVASIIQVSKAVYILERVASFSSKSNR
jgi:hypothetical protein